MSKVKESKKRDERKAALEPYTHMKHLEESLSDLTKSHKSKLNTLKNSFKLMTDDVQKLKQEVVKSQDIIKDLRADIAGKNEELSKAAKQQQTLDAENKTLKNNLMKIEEKFAHLEVTYDRNVETMSLETNRLKQDIETQANVHKKLAAEYAENSNKLKESLVEKSNSLAELNERLQKLVSSFEEHKETSSKKHEETIVALKAELSNLNVKLAEKDAELVKINTDKRELEDSKNKIIDEQTYKIREIERIFEQPLKRVQPQLNLSSVSLTQIAPFPFSDPAAANVVSSNMPINNSIAVQANASRPDTRPESIRATQNSQGTDTSRKATKRRQRERRFIPINEISDSDSDISHHVPNFHVDINNNSHTAVAADSSPIRGFGTLKRSYVQRRDIPDTSESEFNFSQIKRSRN